MEGDQLIELADWMIDNISTHALTWRATGNLFARFTGRPISTHALTWRATDADDSWLRGYFISTHALTWRATIIYVTCFTGVDNFYPRPHMEGDIEERFAFPNWGNFYPRPHMEGDCAHQGGPADGATDFYPRPHMEGDEV